MNNGINEFWATPVYKENINDSALLDNVCNWIILNENLDKPSSDFQNYDILNNGSEVMKEFKNSVVYPAFKNFLEYFNLDLDKYKNIHFRSWLTGCKSGYNIPIHNHSGSIASAVFYLLCDENQHGELIMLDPRSNANRGFQEEFKHHFENKIYTPKSGEFVIFPGYLYHQTVPFTGSIRLAMPVDLFLTRHND